MAPKKWWRLLPLVVALLVRGLWLNTLPADPLEPLDAQGFHLLAVNLLNGHGLSWGEQAPYCPTALRTPGYPTFLAGWYALTGPDPANAVLLHLLLEVVSTTLVMRLVMILLDRKVRDYSWCPVVAGMLYALNGITPRYVGVLYAELAFVPVFLAALCVTLRLIRYPRIHTAFPTGLLWAIATFIKPNIQYLVLVIGVGICVILLYRYIKNKCKKYIISAFIVIVSMGLPLLFWIARNGLITGQWQLSTAFDENLARVTAVSILAAQDGQAVEPWTETWEHYYDTFLDNTVRDQAWVFRAEPADVCVVRASLEPRVTQAARTLLRENRWLYIRVHLKGVFRGLRDTGHRYWYQLLTGRPWASTGVVADMGKRVAWSLERWAVWDALEAFWSQRVRDIPPVAALVWWSLVSLRALVYLSALRGWLRLRHHWLGMALLAICIAYLWLLPGPIAYERFFIPAQPLIYALAAVGMINLTAYNKAHPESSPDIS